MGPKSIAKLLLFLLFTMFFYEKITSFLPRNYRLFTDNLIVKLFSETRVQELKRLHFL